MTTPKVGHIFRLAQIIQESCEHCTDQEATSLAKAILEHPGSRWCPQQMPEPVPVSERLPGPTIMEIIAMADEIEEEGLGQVDLVRRALARWGRPAIEPVPEPPADGEVAELVAALEADAECVEVEHYDLCNMTAEQMRRAATLLQQQQHLLGLACAELDAFMEQQSAPAPVPELLSTEDLKND